MPPRTVHATLLAAALAATAAPADAGLLEITDTGVAGCKLLDFDSFVASGHNGVYRGAGMNPGGPAGGVCSNTWAVRGLSDGVPMTRAQLGQGAGDAEFTRTYITRRGDGPDGQPTDLPSDFARGTSTGAGDTLGGMYGYDVSSASGAAGVDRAFGVRTGGGDFGDLGAAGEIFFRLENNTGVTVNDWQVSFDAYTRNDTARGGELTLAVGLPGTEGQTDPTLTNRDDPAGGKLPLAYAELAAGAVTLADAADSLGWVRTGRTLRIAATVGRSEIFQLRWRLAALTGGSAGELGDAFAIDNLKIVAAPAAVPEPGTLALLGLAGVGFAARRRRRK